MHLSDVVLQPPKVAIFPSGLFFAPKTPLPLEIYSPATVDLQDLPFSDWILWCVLQLSAKAQDLIWQIDYTGDPGFGAAFYPILGPGSKRETTSRYLRRFWIPSWPSPWILLRFFELFKGLTAVHIRGSRCTTNGPTPSCVCHPVLPLTLTE